MSGTKPKYIPLPKAAQKYYYTAPTIVVWVKRGHITGVKQAGKWWIEEKSLIAYLESKAELS
jgi:hypothetical protein